MDNLTLISLIEVYPTLYNSKHPNYANLDIRQNIWEEIGKKMKQSGNICRERWTRLRDNHRRALKLRKTKSGIKAPKYDKEMSFLVPYLFDDEDISDIPSPSHFDYNDHYDDDEIDEKPFQHSEPFVSEIKNDPMNPLAEEAVTQRTFTESFSPIHFSNRNIRKRPATPNENSRIAESRELPQISSIFTDYVDEKKQRISCDALTAFFMTMAETVRAFPIPDQIKVKRDIFHIVTDVESKIALEYELKRK